MNSYKLYVDDIFRTTIKAYNADEVYKIAASVYGFYRIKVVEI